MTVRTRARSVTWVRRAGSLRMWHRGQSRTSSRLNRPFDSDTRLNQLADAVADTASRAPAARLRKTTAGQYSSFRKTMQRRANYSEVGPMLEQGLVETVVWSEAAR